MIDKLKRAGDSDLVIRNGVIDDIRSQRIETGYNKLFTVRWYKIYGKEIQHHSLPVSAYNEMARLVKGDDYQDGELIDMLGEVKTHRGELYVELKAIERVMV